MRPVSVVALLVVSGCASLEGPPMGGTGPSGGGVPGGASSGGNGGNGAAGGSPAASTCKRVDLVFSVDNSGSMSEEKQAMAIEVFPAFARALEQVGGGLEDFQVGVLDACPKPARFLTRGGGGACNFASGMPWMSSSTATLESEFRCVGDIDSSASLCDGKNDDEQPASAAAAALEGGNPGFLRADALLVVVAITDEDEQPVPTRSAQEVYERLVAIKGGDVRRMVFLGIGGATACAGTYGDAKQATVLKQVTDRFTAAGRGIFWDLCQGKLQDGLTQAMSVIDSACGELPPIL
jgi:hypothetical protein